MHETIQAISKIKKKNQCLSPFLVFFLLMYLKKIMKEKKKNVEIQINQSKGLLIHHNSLLSHFSFFLYWIQKSYNIVFDNIHESTNIQYTIH